MPSSTKTGEAGENIKTRYCGDLAELADLDVLTRQLECPSCYEVPLPPIYLCTAGHNVCFSCKSQLDKCPLCKAPFSTTRNFVMEGVILASKFNCNYKHHGCMELILGERFHEHAKACLYRNGAISKEKKPQSSSSTNANDESSSRPTTVGHVGGCCQWISSSSNDPIPQDAVEGGFEHGTLLYVSRSTYNGGTFPGKLNAQSRQHFFPLGTEGRTSNDYEVLVASPDSVQWVTAERGQFPPNPIIGGRTELGEDLYIGRCGYNGTLTVGWVLPWNNRVMSTSNNIVITNAIFEVLVKTELGVALDLSSA